MSKATTRMSQSKSKSKPAASALDGLLTLTRFSKQDTQRIVEGPGEGASQGAGEAAFALAQAFQAKEVLRIQALNLALNALQAINNETAKAALKSIEALVNAQAGLPMEPGWIVQSPSYGKWFISKAAVAADWKQDHEQAYPGEPVPEPTPDTLETWFYEQISWIEISVYGVQLEGINVVKHLESAYQAMRGDTDLPGSFGKSQEI